MSEQMWNGGKRAMLIESPTQLLSDNSNVIIQFGIERDRVSGFTIPRLKVSYTKVE